LEYTYREVSVEENQLRLYSELFKKCYKRNEHLTYDYLKWLYASNPEGNAIGFDAFFKDQMAAHYVCIPVKYCLNENETRGLLSLNTATHPNHQRKGLFAKLADKTYNFAIENDYKFVIGVANSQSTHGFLKRLGFKFVRPLDIKMGIGYPNIDSPKKGRYKFYRIWDKDSFYWRNKNPEQCYDLKKVTNNFFVTANTGILGIRAILYDSRLKNYHIFSAKRKFYFNPLKIWMGIDSFKSWNNTFFFNLPDRMKTSPLNLIFKDLTKREIKLDPKFIKFTGFDFDAY